ncbi:phospholipid-binding protein MlaC [Aestuariibacter sp. AA17]|uniref:Phospholipid-binding protein MlaC n=1 Tax=Fluctibacter corallii TaxID=2984329 RepID=A0ABT3A4N9_9ALTE|nr:phospholipid-binding protein MlaC [Aestuariibacter sp. AA17]MCV2883650.1 phospholipid-binding protein MlaC [Aestuariibacter sp. AA17]
MYTNIKAWVSTVVLVLVSAVSMPSMAEQKEYENPYEMIHEVAQVTFDRIKNEQPEIKQNPDLLKQIMEEELLPYVDYKFSAYKVLGKYFKKVPKDKLVEYIQVFREYLITTYAVALGYYDNQTVQFEPVSDVEGDNNVTVRAIVKEPGRPDIKLAFKVRKNTKTNEWKAYDMVAEGISVLSSKQKEFESILRQEGVDKVIALMREKVQQPIEIKKRDEEA